jgi:hypothetical protein
METLLDKSFSLVPSSHPKAPKINLVGSPGRLPGTLRVRKGRTCQSCTASPVDSWAAFNACVSI